MLRMALVGIQMTVVVESRPPGFRPVIRMEMGVIR